MASDVHPSCLQSVTTQEQNGKNTVVQLERNLLDVPANSTHFCDITVEMNFIHWHRLVTMFYRAEAHSIGVACFYGRSFDWFLGLSPSIGLCVIPAIAALSLVALYGKIRKGSVFELLQHVEPFILGISSELQGGVLPCKKAGLQNFAGVICFP